MVQSPSAHACLYCRTLGYLISSGKCIFTQFWRWFPLAHAGRTSTNIKINPPVTMKKRVTSKNNTLQYDRNTQAPPYREVNDLRPGLPGDQIISDVTERADSNVFWRLPYYWNLGPPVFSSYDGMHTIAGVMKDIFGCLTPTNRGGTKGGQARITETVKAYETKHNRWVQRGNVFSKQYYIVVAVTGLAMDIHV